MPHWPNPRGSQVRKGQKKDGEMTGKDRKRTAPGPVPVLAESWPLCSRKVSLAEKSKKAGRPEMTCPTLVRPLPDPCLIIVSPWPRGKSSIDGRGLEEIPDSVGRPRQEVKKRTKNDRKRQKSESVLTATARVRYYVGSCTGEGMNREMAEVYNGPDP